MKPSLPHPEPVVVPKPKRVMKANAKEMVASGFAPEHARGSQEVNRIKRRFPSAHIISKATARSKMLQQD